MSVYLVLEDYVDPGGSGVMPATARRETVHYCSTAADRSELLKHLCALNLFHRDAKAMSAIAEELRQRLPAGAGARLVNALNGGLGKPRVLLCRQAILAAIRHILTMDECSEPHYQMHPSTAALILTHALASTLSSTTNEPGQPQIGGFPADLAMEMIRNAAFNETDDPVAVLDRQIMLWRDLGGPSEHYLPGVDPADVVLQASGLEVEEFLALGFRTYAHAINWAPPRPLLLERDFGGDVAEDRQAAFRRQVTATVEEFATELATGGAGPWNFLAFQRHPILELTDGLLVVDSQFMLERFTSGLYWLVHDHLKAQSEKSRRQWTQLWGARLQELAGRPLRPLALPLLGGGTSFYSDQDLAATYTTKHNPDSQCDFVLDFGDGFVAFEVVGGQLTLDTRVYGDLNAFAGDMKKLVLKKARQLDVTARNLIAAPAKLTGCQPPKQPFVLPVIVANGGFPNIVATSGYIADAIASEGLLAPPIEPLAVIELTELEMLEALSEQGESTVALVRGWRDSSFERGSLRNYLLHRFGAGPNIYRPARLIPRWDAAIERSRAASDPAQRVRCLLAPDRGGHDGRGAHGSTRRSLIATASVTETLGRGRVRPCRTLRVVAAAHQVARIPGYSHSGIEPYPSAPRREAPAYAEGNSLLFACVDGGCLACRAGGRTAGRSGRTRERSARTGRLVVHHGWVDLNPERILVVDLDPSESNVWRYGLADCAGEMVVAGRLRFDPVTEQLEPVGDRDDLFPTAALLVRQKRYLPPIRYDLTIRPLQEVLRGPPGEGKTASSNAGPHRRATEGKAKGGGRTLGERAAGDPGPRGAPGGPGGR